MSAHKKMTDAFYGSVTVGERGQVVIPAEARKKYAIEAGDKLIVMGTPHEEGLILCKIDALREFMKVVLGDLERVEEMAVNTAPVQAHPAGRMKVEARDDKYAAGDNSRDALAQRGRGTDCHAAAPCSCCGPRL